MQMHIKRLLEGKTVLFIAVLYSTVITILFFLPSQDLPNTRLPGADKVIHALIYFILANVWLLYLYLKKDFQLNTKWILALLVSLLLYGIIVEIIQGLFTDNRSADIFDVAANLIGSVLGIYFFKSIKNKLIA